MEGRQRLRLDGREDDGCAGCVNGPNPMAPMSAPWIDAGALARPRQYVSGPISPVAVISPGSMSVSVNPSDRHGHRTDGVSEPAVAGVWSPATAERRTRHQMSAVV